MRVNLILGSDPFITYETPYLEELDEFQTYMSYFYPDITLTRGQNKFNHTVLIGQTSGKSCSKVTLKNPFQNFTFNTSHVHQFHIPASSMLFDQYMGFPLGSCMFSILFVYDAGFTEKALLMGDPFFNNFNISLDYDTAVLGIQGYKTPVPVDPITPVEPTPEPTPEPPTPTPGPPTPTPPTPTPVPPIVDPEEEDPWQEEQEEEEQGLVDDVEEEYRPPNKNENRNLGVFFFVVGVIASIVLVYIFYRVRKQRQLNDQLAQYNQIDNGRRRSTI